MSEPTVVLYVRIPVELRQQLDQVVMRDRSSMQRVVTALLSNALTPAVSRVVKGEQRSLSFEAMRKKRAAVQGKKVRK